MKTDIHPDVRDRHGQVRVRQYVPDPLHAVRDPHGHLRRRATRSTRASRSSSTPLVASSASARSTPGSQPEPQGPARRSARQIRRGRRRAFGRSERAGPEAIRRVGARAPAVGAREVELAHPAAEVRERARAKHASSLSLIDPEMAAEARAEAERLVAQIARPRGGAHATAAAARSARRPQRPSSRFAPVPAATRPRSSPPISTACTRATSSASAGGSRRSPSPTARSAA